MSSECAPDLSLFIDILRTLEAIGAPHMIIGAFAATVYGVNRVTYDIDIVVDLDESHIQALANAYPLPRYYADPMHMRNVIRLGMMFNIIDTSRGEKADLVPLLKVWCARLEDVIVGKLMAWAEERSRRHETDIYEMMVFHYLGVHRPVGEPLDEAYVDDQASKLGREVTELWRSIVDAAHEEADRARE